MWLKKHKIKIISAVVIAAALAATFWYGGNAPGSRGLPNSDAIPLAEFSAPQTASVQDNDKTDTDANTPTPDTSPALSVSMPDDAQQTPNDSTVPSEDIFATANPAATATPDIALSPLPVDSGDAAVGTAALTCTIAVSCATVLDNLDYLDKEKWELIPEDGWILKAVTATFYEGESVFNVLQRVMKQNKIHLEFVNTPIYSLSYIEGINNLYEFDVGEESGWMYKVNDWFPNYGCSRYQLNDGDAIEWVYTCDLGFDVGGGYAAGNGA